VKLKKLSIITITILLSLLFSGCSQKVVVQKELLCYELQEVSISEDVMVRVHKDDIELFKARNDELKSAISFYENQNKLYKMECEK
jgi:PBP1b-binding outer membrane lipoprotein LpoB